MKLARRGSPDLPVQNFQEDTAIILSDFVASPMSSIVTRHAQDASTVGIGVEAKSVTVLTKTIEPSTMSFTALPNDSANTPLERKSDITKWKLMDFPGISLVNTLNKCWFHASLHFLIGIPRLRSISLSVPSDVTRLDSKLFEAIRAIFHMHCSP